MTNIESLTVAEFLDQLQVIAEEAAAANGGVDFVYRRVTRPGYDAPQCFYVVLGKPSCIMGRWFVRFGGKFPEQLHEGPRARILMDRFYGMRVGTRLGGAANLVQMMQDDGSGWLEAVREVRDMVGVAA
jgi:hypothetical protein